MWLKNNINNYYEKCENVQGPCPQNSAATTAVSSSLLRDKYFFYQHLAALPPANILLSLPSLTAAASHHIYYCEYTVSVMGKVPVLSFMNCASVTKTVLLAANAFKW